MTNFQYVPANSIIPIKDVSIPALVYYQRDSVRPTVRLYAVGDIALSGKARKSGNELGFETLLRSLAPVFQSGDIVFGNLEVPFTSQPATVKYTAPLEAASSLQKTGFTILHIANNHIYDHGAEGMRETISVLQGDMLLLGGGHTTIDAKRTIRTDIEDIRIAWLGCGRTRQKQDPEGPNYWEFDVDQILEATREAKNQADIVIVSIHIGYMYLDYPSPDQKILGHKLVEAGASLVLMHHPHVLQGIEVFEEGIICYSLGNFLFDPRQGNVVIQEAIPLQQEGGVFVFDLDRTGVSLGAVVPINMDDNCIVNWATGTKGQVTLERLMSISEDISGNHTNAFNHQRAHWHTGRTVKVLAVNLRKGNFRYVLEQLSHVRLEHLKMLIRYGIQRLKMCLAIM